ncbi:Apolipoprotein N-acyltransferase [Candidatus Babela massiliensis]|uniref:Apolipoprotein N-acyltransferase n=2 Tax=Candidatus Babela massiliensis TaxID=673862 RepID=V6DH76_9BACT|nr:Apolipoprotein N-acyltransferase [Candidatus Babela massiliensis]
MLFIYLLLTISALSYTFAFMFLSVTWPLVFIFLIPISHLIVNKNLLSKISFKEGFFWGTIAFSLQPIGTYYSVIKMAENYKIFALFMVIFLIIYQAFYSGLWIFTASKTIDLINLKDKNISKILSLAIITWIYFCFVQNYILWPFGRLEGLFLSSPILPLAIQPKLIYMLHYIKKELLLFFLISCSCLLSLIFTYKKILFKLTIFLLAFSPFIISSLIYSYNKKYISNYKKEWFNKISSISKAYYNPGNNKKSAKEIAQEIKRLKEQNNLTQIILFPESAFFLCDLNQERSLIKYLDKDIHIIIGGIRKKNDKVYNTLYHIYGGKIENIFNKRHSMLLTERGVFRELNIFSYIDKIVQKSYFQSRPIIKPSNKERMSFNIDRNLQLIPYICSEVFFNNYPDDNFQDDSTIISLCNDSWLEPCAKYIQNLMVLANKFKAIYWRRYIIYVDYSSSYIFDKFGNQHKLINI